MKVLGAVLGGALACLFALILLVGVVAGAGQVSDSLSNSGSCLTDAPAVTVDLTGLPTQVGAFGTDQLVGAAEIMRAGQDAGVPVRGQTIGVMTSIGESTLTAVEHGDLAGPDSIGWFQQRNPWGPRDVRLDAYGSATMFFTGGQGGQDGLLDILGWESMTPTAAAHAVQRNADPYHYAKSWDDAVAIVEALAGAPVTGIAPGTGDQSCTNEAPGAVVPAGAWTTPVDAPVTSEFGPRWGTMHNGMDFGAPCKTPIWSAADGVVILAAKGNRPPATGYGTLVAVDHGGGIVTRYAHAANEDVLVPVGEQVRAGEQITRVGTYGDSIGCHLHFEVQSNGLFVDPRPFLTQRSISLAALFAPPSPPAQRDLTLAA